MTIIRLNQLSKNQYEKISTINKKLHEQEGSVDTIGKIHLSNDLMHLNIGRHSGLVHLVLHYQMF
mgnify:CR=1 FL=1